MKKLMTIILATSVVSLFAFTAKLAHTLVYKLDDKASSVIWSGEKVTGKHSGTILFSSGMLSNDHGNWSGTFEMDMNTIVCTDLKPGEGKEKMEGHLKSSGFFDVEKYPKSKLVINSIVPLAAATETATHTAKGILTIKDKSNPVSFNVKLIMAGNTVACTGTAIIDRSKYDVRYGSKSFFDDLGDKAIYDEFELKFNVNLIN